MEKTKATHSAMQFIADCLSAAKLALWLSNMRVASEERGVRHNAQTEEQK